MDENKIWTQLKVAMEQCAHDDWDCYGALKISEDSIDEAIFLMRLFPQDISTPELGVEPTGLVGFEWFSKDKKSRFLFIIVKNELVYAGILNSLIFGKRKLHGTYKFDQFWEKKLPRKILRILKKYFK